MGSFGENVNDCGLLGGKGDKSGFGVVSFQGAFVCEVEGIVCVFFGYV